MEQEEDMLLNVVDDYLKEYDLVSKNMAGSDYKSYLKKKTEYVRAILKQEEEQFRKNNPEPENEEERDAWRMKLQEEKDRILFRTLLPVPPGR
ncbi:hypothetical protein [Leptospirillum ferriphilum]|uniref:hypothetical protein n=1 Tax=Leptospirillum ferriphilum TaxID=178606 RepID=UPI0006B1D7B0|nr:hypothetical protein [Leptospirillum ferriphilum]